MAAAPLPIPPPVTNYSQYFHRDEHDPYHGAYGPLLAEFRVDNIPPTADDLRHLVQTADEGYPGGYLMVVEEPAGEFVYMLLHSLSRYP